MVLDEELCVVVDNLIIETKNIVNTDKKANIKIEAKYSDQETYTEKTSTKVSIEQNSQKNYADKLGKFKLFDSGSNINPQKLIDEFSYTDETQIVDMSFAHSINVTKYSSITTEVYIDSERVFSQGAGNGSSSGGGGSRIKYNLFQDYNSGNVYKVEIPGTGYFGGNVSVHIIAIFR